MKEKPDKPYADFPLFPHDNGQWAKKINGKLHYFGKWDDPDAAGERYERDREALYAGRDPMNKGSGIRLDVGCDAFLAAKHSLRQSKEISERTYDEYFSTCKRLLDFFGRSRAVSSLVPADFDSLREELAKTRGPVTLGNEITRVRCVFKYMDDAVLIDRPVRFGPHFRKPSARAMRIAKDEAGVKLFTSEEVQALLAKANSRMKAMIYLGINCGLGNTDIGNLRKRHLDLKGGWLNYPRPKTGIKRRAKLWPETVEAIRNLPTRRATVKDNAALTFITQTGNAWSTGSRDSPIAKEMAKLLIACGMKRKGLSFYALRHTFQTIGEEAKDLPAVKAIMGHAPQSGDMSSVYRQLVSDRRLEDVADYVRGWLLGTANVQQKVS